MDGPKVYADLTFAINFIMDFFLLWATARIAGIKVIYSRIAAAALLGGIYAVGFLLPELSKWYNIQFKILFSCLLVIFALSPQNWTEFKKTIFYFYGINFAVAGATVATSYLFSSSMQIISLPYFWLLGGVFCAIAIGIYGEKYFVSHIIPKLLNFDIELRFNNLKCKGKGLLDTGNGLRDPLTNKPVLVAEYGLLRDCLPDDFKQAMENVGDENEMLDGLAQSSWANRLRLIPFTSIGKKNGLLVGIRADEIIVDIGKNSIFHKNLVVGIYKERLSKEGNYQLLIPSEILENI